MKIRNGFVSNSSSSSFIVFFPEEITSKEQLSKYVLNEEIEKSIKSRWNFNIQEKIIKKYSKFINESYNDVGMTYEKFKESCINSIFKTIESEGPNNYFYALSYLDGDCWIDDDDRLHIGWDDNLIVSNIEELREKITEYKDLEKEIDDFDWENNEENEYDRLSEELNNLSALYYLNQHLEEIDEAVEKNINMVFYSFAYSDEDGTFFGIMEQGGIWNDDLKVYVESNH